MSLRSLAIFCGSKNGNNPLFVQHAQALGRMLAERGVALIYGGGRNGLMGAAADSVMSAGGKVHGIIPQHLRQWEHQHNDITELVVVEDMHVRKRTLYERCDAALILPGGFGTLDELFEILTWNQLSLHNKKVFLLNSAGFYDHLLAHLRTMQEEGFLYTNIEEQVIVLASPEEMEQHL
ncbi:TIGR00730 family Rossman fold protein [Flaviaesturariibacter amylovorans]|uniref:Cytokinin riboside 5'-monophosphate phosphoribohydrolase n=1 Tax=Flaviaesturariibacter amylovorans TaxID=1084520 RepID=A0ABP8HBE2_9BACT